MAAGKLCVAGCMRGVVQKSVRTPKRDAREAVPLRKSVFREGGRMRWSIPNESEVEQHSKSKYTPYSVSPYSGHLEQNTGQL